MIISIITISMMFTIIIIIIIIIPKTTCGPWSLGTPTYLS